jgi:HK97 family phage portal protein
MILSGGVVVKQAVQWSGSPATWGSWPAQLQIGSQWVSYAAMYKRQTWVRTVIDKRADLLARLPLKVYEHDDLNRPEVPDHPYAQLLRQPNPIHSRFWLWRWVQATYDTYGESFLGKQRDRSGRPNMLVPLHPMSMHAKEERDGRVMWDFDNGRVRFTDIPDEDLIHPASYNPESYTRGLSKLESLRATLENEDAALRAQSSFWRNGARPGVALSHPTKISKGAQDRLKLEWNQLTAGPDNFGTTVILEEGMKPEIMQLSAEEAQYIDARKLNREEVVAAYDMPPPAVHILDQATYSNITAQLRSVYRDTMAPICIMHESELETQLRGSVRPGASEPDFSDDVYAEFLMDGVLRGDFEERMDAYQKGVNSGTITPAEVRKLENLPFIEGSDRLFINSTMVPIEIQAEPEQLALPPAQGLDENAMRMVMGRLSRQKTLDEVDRKSLVVGLNGEAPLVLAELDAAVAAGEGVMAFRERIKGLALGGYRDEYVELIKALVAKEQPASVVNVSVPTAPPIDVHFDDGAFVANLQAPNLDVRMPDVYVDSPVAVNIPKPASKRIERDADGNIIRVVEEND